MPISRKHIFLTISTIIFVIICFGMGAYVNRPIIQKENFSEDSDQRLRVLVHSDTSTFDPVPFWNDLQEQDTTGIFDFETIPHSMDEAEVIVYFLSSWKNYRKLPEVDSYEGGLKELETADQSVFYREFRARHKHFNRDLHIVFFNRNAVGTTQIPAICFAKSLLLGVTDWSVYFDFPTCIKENGSLL